MCVKLSSGHLNLGPCPPHPTSTYTCGVTIAPRMCGGSSNNYKAVKKNTKYKKKKKKTKTKTNKCTLR